MKVSSNYITICADNLPTYGFVCFHRKGEPRIRNDVWNREIDISVDSVHGNKSIIFQIPTKYLIELSDDKKIVNSEPHQLQSKADSREIIKLLSERAGWNQTKEDLSAMLAHGNDGIYISKYKVGKYNLPLGSGISLPVNDKMAWIGMILVHPELRRQGIARSIMNVCLMHARTNQKKKVVGLDATPLGKQVYDSLGFKDSFTIWRSILPTNQRLDISKKLQITELDFSPVRKFLIKKDYYERISIYNLLYKIPGSKSITILSDKKIVGFAMSRPGRLMPFVGPVIADSNYAASYLIKTLLHYWNNSGFESVFMDIPEQHFSESIFVHDDQSFRSLGNQIIAKPLRSLIRMYQFLSKEEITKNESMKESFSIPGVNSSMEETNNFMLKEKNDIVPIMFGTSGPEWS